MHPTIQALSTPEVMPFMREHEQFDPTKLLLKYQNSHLPISLIAQQLELRQRAKHKLPSWHNTDVLYPSRQALEQCTSEAVARFKSSIINGGNSFVDLTGGLGVDTFFIGRQFDQTTYVEKNLELAQFAAYNAKQLALNMEVIHQDALTYLEQMPTVHVIYLDPARRTHGGQRNFFLEHGSPNVVAILDSFLKKAESTWVKTSPLLDISRAIEQFKGHAHRLFVLATKNECKELLFELKPEKTSDLTIIATNLRLNNQETYRFTPSAELLTPTITAPKKYIFEPNTAILKAGGFNSLACKFELEKLHKSTHLYTSNHLCSNFPGTTFELIDILPIQRKKVTQAIGHNKITLKRRNFPSKQYQQIMQWKLKEGNDSTLIATTIHDDTRCILWVKPIK